MRGRGRGGMNRNNFNNQRPEPYPSGGQKRIGMQGGGPPGVGGPGPMRGRYDQPPQQMPPPHMMQHIPPQQMPPHGNGYGAPPPK